MFDCGYEGFGYLFWFMVVFVIVLGFVLIWLVFLLGFGVVWIFLIVVVIVVFVFMVWCMCKFV